MTGVALLTRLMNRSRNLNHESNGGFALHPSLNSFFAGRVEERRGDLGRAATLRFLSPLIKPDVPISGIRLSD
jgi:hypothetical protein